MNDENTHPGFNPDTTPENVKGTGLSRRSFAVGAAWSVPVIALASAVPRAAASVVEGDLRIRFLQPLYDITTNTASNAVVAVVERIVGGVATPVPGASITFAILPGPDGSGPDDPSAPAGGSGASPTATLPGGGTVGILSPTDANGMYRIDPLTTGPGFGFRRLTATVTIDGETAQAETLLRIANVSPLLASGWGGNGQLANGNYGWQVAPAYADYPTFHGKQIAGRWHRGGVLLSTAGDLYSWGWGVYGMNAQGTDYTDKSKPTASVTAYAGQKFRSVHKAFYGQGAIDTNGGAYAWGYNWWGVHGFTVAWNSYTGTPSLIHASLETGVKTMALGEYTGFAVKEDGTLWGWGNNRGLVLGSGVALNGQASAPVQIAFPQGAQIVDVAAPSGAVFAVDSDGGLWSWGYNVYNVLGTTSVGNGSWTGTPVKIGEGFVSVDAFPNGFHGAALRADGTGVFWGYNNYGQAGNGGTSPVTTPQNLSMSGIAQVEVGYYGTQLLLTNGDVYYAGINNNGQSGTGQISGPITSFTKVNWMPKPAIDIAQTYATSFYLTN